MSAGGIVWLNTRRSREGSFVTRRGNRGTSSRITESAEEKSRQESGLSCPGSSFGEESLHWYGAELRPPGIATWKIAMISGFSSGLAMSGTLNALLQPAETKRGVLVPNSYDHSNGPGSPIYRSREKSALIRRTAAHIQYGRLTGRVPIRDPRVRGALEILSFCPSVSIDLIQTA